jgi:hypothetical protein
MYRIRYAIAAAVRFVLFYLLRPFVQRGTYDNPADVMGYTGWHSLPVVGVLAFTHETDGIQFYW